MEKFLDEDFNSDSSNNSSEYLQENEIQPKNKIVSQVKINGKVVEGLIEEFSSNSDSSSSNSCSVEELKLFSKPRV